MLKLIIVDDEKIIRETIRSFIDWASLGIEVIGTCKDGIEAYDMILDEYPDIVLTDIKMPGLSGLDLIERIRNADHDVEFILLSGYSDFEYAKTAMKYGVKHYLLKPCNETQIIEVIELVKDDCFKKLSLQAAKEERNLLYYNLKGNILKNILLQYLIEKKDFNDVLQEYEAFLDFSYTGYELCYFYYLEELYFNSFCRQAGEVLKTRYPGVHMHVLYVKNTMVLFFAGFASDHEDLDLLLRQIHPLGNQAVEYRRESFMNLKNLLTTLLKRLERYDKIQILDGNSIVPIYNHSALLHNINELTDQIAADPDLDFPKTLAKIDDLLQSTDDLELLKAFAANFILRLSSILNLTRTSAEMADFFIRLEEDTDADQVRHAVVNKLKEILATPAVSSKKYSDFIEKIITCVEENLADANLSLKWIAGSHLYMNVDYLSKQFFKQTGYKFSQYLTQRRVEKAKELLLTCGQEKIYMIAEQVGCGNNPQYFSQIFKKQTGMTPTAYIKKMEESKYDTQ